MRRFRYRPRHWWNPAPRRGPARGRPVFIKDYRPRIFRGRFMMGDDPHAVDPGEDSFGKTLGFRRTEGAQSSTPTRIWQALNNGGGIVLTETASGYLRGNGFRVIPVTPTQEEKDYIKLSLGPTAGNEELEDGTVRPWDGRLWIYSCALGEAGVTYVPSPSGDKGKYRRYCGRLPDMQPPVGSGSGGGGISVVGEDGVTPGGLQREVEGYPAGDAPYDELERLGGEDAGVEIGAAEFVSGPGTQPSGNPVPPGLAGRTGPGGPGGGGGPGGPGGGGGGGLNPNGFINLGVDIEVVNKASQALAYYQAIQRERDEIVTYLRERGGPYRQSTNNVLAETDGVLVENAQPMQLLVNEGWGSGSANRFGVEPVSTTLVVTKAVVTVVVVVGVVSAIYMVAGLLNKMFGAHDELVKQKLKICEDAKAELKRDGATMTNRRKRLLQHQIRQCNKLLSKPGTLFGDTFDAVKPVAFAALGIYGLSFIGSVFSGGFAAKKARNQEKARRMRQKQRQRGQIIDAQFQQVKPQTQLLLQQVGQSAAE